MKFNLHGRLGLHKKLLIKVTILITTLASTAAHANCVAPWGLPVPEGQFVTAYYSSNPSPGDHCRSEMRFCRNNYLSGTYYYQFCHEDRGCQTEFGYIPDGGSVVTYLNPVEYRGARCTSMNRYCYSGVFSAGYSYRSCREAP